MALPSLPVRPKAEVLSVSDILEYARSGRLRVPKFQTGLRWSAKHVEELFDSIVRGFPVGGLLLWKRPAEAEDLFFGPVQVAADRRPDALHLVDGQQRVTAIVGALDHPDEVPLGDAYALWVNLATGAFSVWREHPSREWIPANLLGDRRRLQHWARTADYGQKTNGFVDQAFRIEEAIIRYTMPAYVVQDAEPDALRLIFSRVNSSGVPLREDEVFQALFGSDAAQPKPLEQMAAWLDEQTGFGKLAPSWLLRCVKAVGGLEPRKSFGEQAPPSGDLIGRTAEAMRRVISFLQNEVGMVHLSVLPYRFPLIVLARFFSTFPEPHSRSRTLLIRWIWRGALSGLHSNSSHAAVASHTMDIGDDEHDSVQRLLSRVPRDPKLPEASSQWYGQAATTAIYAGLMLHLEPIDPTTETPWERDRLLALLSQKELGQLFRPPLKETANWISSRLLLPPRFRGADLQLASDEVLASLCVEGEALTALRSGDARGFIESRAALLEQRLAILMARFASSADGDRPPIAAIARMR